jgi:peptidoglycan/xylan/chitin deacetylase (PgdA/CDA1 family)
MFIHISRPSLFPLDLMRTFTKSLIALLAFFGTFALTQRSIVVLHPAPSVLPTPSIPPTSSLPAPLLISIRPKLVALTFDACPHYGPEGYDDRITKILMDSSAPATIFMSGRWVVEHPLEARALGSIELFEIGNHALSHLHMTREPLNVVRSELAATEAILDSSHIRHVPLYRPPFGETSRGVDSVAASLGLQTVMFDVASGDPDTSFRKDRLVRSVVGSVHDGSIVVLHINGRGWHTAEALPMIITKLRARGFVLVKVSDLNAEAVRQGR